LNFLGIDFGTKIIGIALGDTETKVAVPLFCIENKNDEFVLEELRKICENEKVKKIVLGLPKYLSGEKHKLTQKIKEFGKKISSGLDIYVDYEDERLTSKLAEGKFADQKIDKKEINTVAAAEILQTYLDKL